MEPKKRKPRKDKPKKENGDGAAKPAPERKSSPPPAEVKPKERMRLIDLLKQQGPQSDAEILQYEKETRIAQRKLLHDTWVARNELYRSLFGEPAYVTPENYGAPSPVPEEEPQDAFAGSNDTADPGHPQREEQHLAVLAYAPTEERKYWMYVTAGMCSPWVQDEPAEVSGFGVELMIKSPEDAPWAAQILRSMAFYVFNHAGTLSPGVRIGLNAPIAVQLDSLIRNVIVWYADEAADCWYQLPAGGFGIYSVIGATDDECKYANAIGEYGTWCIQEILRQTGYGQVTDPGRESACDHERFMEISSAVSMFAHTFKETKQPETDLFDF